MTRRLRIPEKVNPEKLTTSLVYLIDYFVTLKYLYPFEALSSDKVRERIKMICAREPDMKAVFPNILACASLEERLRRLKVNINYSHLSYALISI